MLSNVRLTGTTIGNGAYGSVEEVMIPGAVCAAKKIHDILLDSDRITTQFLDELQLMSTLHHPNIVQFLGVCFLQGAQLPALVMERLLTSLHDLLDPETDPPPPPDAPKPFFPLSLKCSILHNAANGLAYLHEQSPPIIHRDLSAKNVLLNSAMVAKIGDLGVARIVPRKIIRALATMTMAPGASVYMPPEAIASAKSNKEQSKYSASIDIFSFGVVSIFTLSQTFPCNLLEPNYTDEESGSLCARTELQRRDEYVQKITPQLPGDHPLMRMIQQCLQNVPTKRPGVRDVLQFLEQARSVVVDEECEMNKLQLLQDRKIRATENAELQQQLQSSEGEKQMVQQQLMRKEAELTRAEETIRREQQQVLLHMVWHVLVL